MSGSQISAPTIFSLIATSSTPVSQTLTSTNSIINLSHNVLPSTSAINLNLNNVKPSSSISLNILNNSTPASGVLLNLSINGYNQLQSSIVPNDVINILISSNGTASFSVGSQSIVNHLIKDFIGSTGTDSSGNNFSIDPPSLTTNPILTKKLLSSKMPDILTPLLDNNLFTGSTGPRGWTGPLGNDGQLLVTTNNLVNNLNQYVQPGYQLSNPGNKLVTTQGNANLITTFFGTLANNPGIISAIAGGIIENNNLTSINLTGDTAFSLIESITITADLFDLFLSDSSNTEPIANLKDIIIDSTSMLRLHPDFITNASHLFPLGGTQTTNITISGNLLGGPVSTPNVTNLNYGLINGSFFTNTFNYQYLNNSNTIVSLPSLFPQLVIKLNGNSITYSTTDSYDRFPLQDGTGYIRFKNNANHSPLDFTFPCNAYGVITSNTSNTNISLNTSPPTIIDTMLPLFNELAVASGLVFNNAIAELKYLLQNLNLGYGNLAALTNYLQAHSENIHIVGKYQSVITINGNQTPFGYSYYNGTSSIDNVAIVPPNGNNWSQLLYSPASSSNRFELNGNILQTSIGIGQYGVDLSNSVESDFKGRNSSDGLQLLDDNSILKPATVYPMLNTIIIPANYIGFGSISSYGGIYPFPAYRLSINLNYLTTDINYSSLLNNTYPSLEHSNGTIIQPGTTIKIYNESNYVVQVVSRNLLYNDIYNVIDIKKTLPTPTAPFSTFNPPGPNINDSDPSPEGWPSTENYLSPISSSVYSINLRDTTSDAIYIKAKDSITLVFSTNSEGLSGSWGYI